MKNTVDGSKVSWYPGLNGPVGLTTAEEHPDLKLEDQLPDWITVTSGPMGGPTTLVLVDVLSNGTKIVYGTDTPSGHRTHICIAVA